jgi:hypothetical protein
MTKTIDTSAGTVRVRLRTDGNIGIQSLMWAYCYQAPATYLILLSVDASCDPVYSFGFSALITRSETSHRIEICNYSGKPFHELVNPYNPDGSQTDRVILYSDAEASGGCYIRDVGYQIRKFRADSDYASGPSEWRAPIVIG